MSVLDMFIYALLLLSLPVGMAVGPMLRGKAPRR
jgi:hypothetical protein